MLKSHDYGVRDGCSENAPVQDVDDLATALAVEQARVTNHPVFQAVRDFEDLRMFMEWHVFAVWDFMSLVKRLQRELTCVRVPWSPPASSAAARLINEIVMGEETDEVPGGAHASHYDLYLSAMREVGACTRRIEDVVQRVSRGTSVGEALSEAQAPPPVRRFVENTISTCLAGSTTEVLGSFFFGREDAIPQMFQALLARWGVDPSAAPTFTYYLRRHIELDGEAHGPAAQAIIDQFVDRGQGRTELLASALKAVRERGLLWDALHHEISANDGRRATDQAAQLVETAEPISFQQCAGVSGMCGPNKEAS